MSWCNGIEGHEMEEGENFCSQCGKPQATQCENGHPIRPKVKRSLDPGGGIIDETEIRPEYCTECGSAYEWTIAEASV